MTLFLNNRAFQQNVLNNPILFIANALKTLERSNKYYDVLMIIVMLHGGKIAKKELLADGISNHEVFADLNEKMDVEGSITGCIEQLLDIFLEKTEDGHSYRILHDVITRCTFIAAFENHWTLLLKECDEILLFECLRLKSLYEICRFSAYIIYNYSNFKISIP